MKKEVRRFSPNVLYHNDQLGEFRVAGFIRTSSGERVLLERDNYWRDRWDATWKAAKEYEDRVVKGTTVQEDTR